MRNNVLSSIVIAAVICVSCNGNRGGGGDGTTDGNIDGDIAMDPYPDIDMRSPCELPEGIVPDPQFGAEGNPTGNPIGGGPGYGDIFDPSSAGYVVSDKAGLMAALASASAGQVIYVDDGARIDMTGEQEVAVPAGVTLASGRGSNGSQGALIFTGQYDTFPLFLARGEGVRFTGLRIGGPDPEIGDHDYENPVLSRGIQSSYRNLMVDNCELWGWSHAAVILTEGSQGHIHHNFIHNNRRAGLGYGVVLDIAEALIEANLFDACRHAIAATGRPGTSYEASYNIVLEHANGHAFDMHGGADRQDGTDTAGTWMRIHHNSFRLTDESAIVIRGVPEETADIHHNWFYDGDPASAVRQTNAEGNMDVHDNFYGPRPPPGTFLPTAAAGAEPFVGRAPLDVAFDGSASCDVDGSIVSHLWDFGDGSAAAGPRASYIFADPGRYNVTLMAADALGIAVKDMAAVTAYPADSNYVLSFWIKDSCRGPLAGYYLKQALVDGQVVYEDDIAGDEGWEHVILDVAGLVEGKDRVTLAFRASSVTAVTDPGSEIIELDVYLDDVILFGGKTVNGDFERPGGWIYSASGDSVPWNGRFVSQEVRSGIGSYDLYHPYDTASVAGSWARIEQVIALLSPDVRGEWRFDEESGELSLDSSMYGNHGRIENMTADACRQDGIMGAALRFDGIDDYVDCGSHQSLESQQGSLEFWVKPEETGTSMDLVALFEDPQSNYFLVRKSEAGQVQVMIEEDGTERVNVVSAGAMQDSNFHHVAVVQAGDASGVTIFIDGAESGAAGTNSTYWTSHLDLGGMWIGRGGGGYFKGIMDNVVLYSRALGADEIRRHADEVYPRGQWHFDEGTGMTTADSSGHGNQGTLVNMDPGSCWVDGVEGTALGFDAVDDYVDCGNDESLHLADFMTVEMWVRFDAFGTGEDIMSNNLFRLYHRGEWAGDRIYFLYRIGEQDAPGDSAWDYWSGVCTETQLLQGAWYHLAGVKDGDTMQIYVNGESEKEAGCMSGCTADASAAGSLRIGETPFDGAVDEVTIYPRALKAEEIRRHYLQSR